MLNDKFFIDEAIEERPIEMGDGTSEVLWFKHLPNTAFERYALWCNSKDEDVVAKASPALLVMGVCQPDGTPALTQAQAERIKRPIMLRILAALMEVNGYGKEKPAAGKP